MTEFTLTNLKSKYVDIVYELNGAMVSTLRVHEEESHTDFKISGGGHRLICHEVNGIGSTTLSFTHDKNVQVKIVSIYNRANKLDFLNLSESKHINNHSFNKNKQEVASLTRSLRPYIQWFVTWKCNYKCSYCWQESAEEVYRSERHNTNDVNKWVQAFNDINPVELYLTGGEPTLYKDITTLISRINTDTSLSMTTNFAGSFILDKWFKDVAVDRMTNVCASVHPTQIKDIDKFFDKVLRYIDHYGSDRFQLEMVNHPTNTAILPEDRLLSFCEDNKVRVVIDQYTSVFEDEDPDQDGVSRDLYNNMVQIQTTNTLDFDSLTISAKSEESDLPIVNDSERLPIFCPAGSLRINVDSMGDAYTCMSAIDRSKLFGSHSLPHYKSLGNILDGTFKRLEEPVVCWEKFRCSACDYQRVGEYWRKVDDAFNKQLPICE